MKRKLLLAIVLMTGWRLHAQVVVTLQLPPLGLTVKPQLWNMSLVNTTGAPMTVQVQMIMTDVVTSATVLTGTTPVFLLNAGANNVTAGSVSPVTYSAGSGYNIDPNPNGFLPVGAYNICYIVTKYTSDIQEQLAEDCIAAEVEPISPPQLMQPGDSDRVLFRRPFFTWLPPTPYNTFSNLLYDWILVEVQSTQSAADAIQQNIPVLVQPNIAYTSLQYPLAMPELDTGKVYAWRVTAKNNSSPIANSEVWSFRIQQTATDTFSAPNKGSYAEMRREQDASYFITGTILRFRYQHEMNSNTAHMELTDISTAGHQQVSLDSTELAVKYGANYIDFDIGSNASITDRHMYVLELTNAKGEHWFLKFEYRRPEEQ